jgi:hypothetical protein
MAHRGHYHAPKHHLSAGAHDGWVEGITSLKETDEAVGLLTQVGVLQDASTGVTECCLVMLSQHSCLLPQQTPEFAIAHCLVVIPRPYGILSQSWCIVGHAGGPKPEQAYRQWHSSSWDTNHGERGATKTVGPGLAL